MAQHLQNQDRKVSARLEVIVTSVVLPVSTTANARAAHAHHDARSTGDANSPFASMLDGQTADTTQPSRPDSAQQSDAAARSSDAAQRPDRPDRPKRTRSNDSQSTDDNKPAKADGGKAASSDNTCLLYTSPSPRDRTRSRMPSSA